MEGAGKACEMGGMDGEERDDDLNVQRGDHLVAVEKETVELDATQLDDILAGLTLLRLFLQLPQFLLPILPKQAFFVLQLILFMSLLLLRSRLVAQQKKAPNKRAKRRIEIQTARENGASKMYVRDAT